MLTACVVALVTGRPAAGALMDSGAGAVEMTLTLMGSMVLWSGLMEVLRATGDVERLGRGLRRLLSPLFGSIKDDACWAAMGMNLAANMLGLGNAATPAGIRAAELCESIGHAAGAEQLRPAADAHHGDGPALGGGSDESGGYLAAGAAFFRGGHGMRLRADVAFEPEEAAWLKAWYWRWRR